MFLSRRRESIKTLNINMTPLTTRLVLIGSLTWNIEKENILVMIEFKPHYAKCRNSTVKDTLLGTPWLGPCFPFLTLLICDGKDSTRPHWHDSITKLLQIWLQIHDVILMFHHISKVLVLDWDLVTVDTIQFELIWALIWGKIDPCFCVFLH